MIMGHSVRTIPKKSDYTIVMGFFALGFMLISFVNHYQFRTYSLDLGLYNQTLFDYAHGRFNFSTLLEPDFHLRNQLADHFDLWLFLIAPLYFIFGSYTLLGVQIAAILIGGLGIAKSIETLSHDTKMPLFAMIHFYSLWGIYAALSFDYHSNVVASMFVPWLFYHHQKKNLYAAVLVFVFILICKENMALWAVFIASGFAWFFRKEAVIRNLNLALLFFAIIYFVLATKVFMPAFSTKDQAYIHFDFLVLGANYGEAIKSILLHPVNNAIYLFKSHLNLPEAFGIKKELHTFILLSGGLALIFEPAFLWILLPIYGQKLFNDDFTKWGINHHYSIEFAPILTLALFISLERLHKNYRKAFALLFMIMALSITIYGMHKRVSKWYNEPNENLFNKKHYHRSLDLRRINGVIKKIPDNFSVSASNTLTPHLAFRKEIYQYPFVNNAQLILLLDEQESYYPLIETDFSLKFAELKKDSNYVCKLHEYPFYVFVRKDISFSVGD